tara:strand:- start:1398 stop:1793 length:396 start_codon:yes stop_codon:yes gene_type:complete
MWNNIIEIKEWFGEIKERYQLVKSFNRTAKYSFISGMAPSLLEAKITQGDSNYKHAFSKWRGGGFRIKALSGKELNRTELIEIGRVILDNEPLIREMISLGWDTLEVHGNIGNNGSKWALKEYANIGGYIN